MSSCRVGVRAVGKLLVLSALAHCAGSGRPAAMMGLVPDRAASPPTGGMVAPTANSTPVTTEHASGAPSAMDSPAREESAALSVAAPSETATTRAPSPPRADRAVARRAAPAGRAQDATGGAASAAAVASEADDQVAVQQRPRDGQPTTWQRAQAASNAVRLAIGDRETLPLRGMQFRAQVDGLRARVVVDAYFYNDRGQNFEGTFQLRLPDGASPFFFAFGETAYAAPQGQQPDVHFFPSPDHSQGAGLSPDEIMRQRAPSWQQPREARVVPREQAALAYTESVRQRVDPALMEWSGAGLFEGRVFPLQPGRMHRVVFGYDVALERRGDSRVFPLALPQGVPTVVDLAVARVAGQNATVAPSASARTDAQYSYYRYEQPRAAAVTVSLRGAVPTLVGGDPLTGSYLAAEVPVAIAQAEPARGSDRAVFVLDTSLSAQPAQFGTRLRLMRALLERNRPALRQFAVVFFDVAARWWRSGWTENTPANVEALLADGNALALEGATDLGAALGAAAAPVWNTPGTGATEWDTFLLSDGAPTWGETNAARLAQRFVARHRGAIFAYRVAGAVTDGATLATLTRETRGGLFALADESEVGTVAVAHRSAGWTLRGATLAGASDLVFAGNPAQVYPGQVLQLAARGTPAPGASVALELARGERTMTVRVPLGPALSSALAPRTYGQYAVDRLEEIDPAAHATARAYATHFRVTGRTCSLVMLEREADYARYGIVPADDAREVRSAHLEALLGDAQRAAAATLADPRADFLAWMDRLPRQPGVSIQIPGALRAALAQLPAAAFEVAAEALAPRLLRRTELPSAFLAQLAQPELDYALVQAEAERRRRTASAADGVKALSSLVERRPGDTVLARDVAFTASTWGLPGAGYHLLRRVAEMRPYEPQTYRALAETLAAMGRNDLAMAYFELGLAGEWGPRTRDFRTIVGVEYLHFLREIARGSRRVTATEFARGRIGAVDQLVGLARADVLVMIAWNTDETDVDLHVVEPSGEECYYGHRETQAGGHLTQDVTTGFGPEMYLLPHARPGHYRVFAHFFASHQSRASARTRVQATVVRRWGAADEQVSQRMVTLNESNERQAIADLDIGQ